MAWIKCEYDRVKWIMWMSGKNFDIRSQLIHLKTKNQKNYRLWRGLTQILIWFSTRLLHLFAYLLMYIDVSWCCTSLYNMLYCLPFLLLTKFYLQFFPSRVTLVIFLTSCSTWFLHLFHLFLLRIDVLW